VRVNLRSPIHAADVTARGQRPEVQANPAARPLWRTVSSAGTYDWLDPRPRLQSSWSVPILVGTRRLSITGALSAPPPVAGAGAGVGAARAARSRALGAQHRKPGGSSVALWVGIGMLAVFAFLAAAVFARRRVRT
jgi:hypothetical protein